MFLTINSTASLKEFLKEQKKSGKKIGFVPTMGALHQGHLSLVEKSCIDCDVTVVSIFVNPTQFNDKSDYNRYPRIPEKDFDLLAKTKCDVVFLPSADEMYPDGLNNIEIPSIEQIDKVLEGSKRPGHFDGVITIVKKLFDIVEPDKAFFGQKDYQQCLVIKKMTKAFNLDIEIVVCPIIRENDGLAMSSRNMLLNDEERRFAPKIYQSLKTAQEMLKNHSIEEIKNQVTSFLSTAPFVKIDYFEIVDANNLKAIKSISNYKEVVICTAIFVGKIRLIDNILVNLEYVY